MIIKSPVLIELIYYRPDHKWLLQQFCWECDDVAPRFPRVHKFLRYWRANVGLIMIAMDH